MNQVKWSFLVKNGVLYTSFVNRSLNGRCGEVILAVGSRFRNCCYRREVVVVVVER